MTRDGLSESFIRGCEKQDRRGSFPKVRTWTEPFYRPGKRGKVSPVREEKFGKDKGVFSWWLI